MNFPPQLSEIKCPLCTKKSTSIDKTASILHFVRGTIVMSPATGTSGERQYDGYINRCVVCNSQVKTNIGQNKNRQLCGIWEEIIQADEIRNPTSDFRFGLLQKAVGRVTYIHQKQKVNKAMEKGKKRKRNSDDNAGDREAKRLKIMEQEFRDIHPRALNNVVDTALEKGLTPALNRLIEDNFLDQLAYRYSEATFMGLISCRPSFNIAALANDIATSFNDLESGHVNHWSTKQLDNFQALLKKTRPFWLGTKHKADCQLVWDFLQEAVGSLMANRIAF